MLREEKLTLSIGLAELVDSRSLEQFINSADKAMYQAKSEGGNCIALAEKP
jgi:PleD family two-component response regulator